MNSSAPEWAADPALVAFYETHRSAPEDLYPSERRFLPWLARQVDTVLDVGCAAGGFLNIWRHFATGALTYTGVDVSVQLIESARRLHPGVEFLVGDCAAGLPATLARSEAVQALGWLHWEPRYEAALRELWRLTNRWLFFDVRLVEGEHNLETGRQRLALHEGSGADTSTPYICVAWNNFARLLRDLRPARIYAYGYWGPPADTVEGVARDVCFATFVLERSSNPASSQTTAALEMPLEWPPPWETDVQRLTEDLDAYIPLPGTGPGGE